MRIRTRRTVAAACAAVLALALATTAVATAFDYTLFGTSDNTWTTRGVDHDYYFIRGTVTGSTTVCVKRNPTGDSFCAQGTQSKSYVDSCNPSACLSYYKQTSGGSLDITAHDEWH
jgi:hypothetical protein